MLGYEESELPNHLDIWRRLVHPDDDDQEMVLKKIRDYVEGRADSFEVEMRMRRKNGQYRRSIIFCRRGHVIYTKH